MSASGAKKRRGEERRRSRWRSERGKKKMERNGEGGTKCGGKALRTPKHTM